MKPCSSSTAFQSPLKNEVQSWSTAFSKVRNDHDTPVPDPQDCKDAKVLLSFDSVDKPLLIFSWGWNGDGQLGLGDFSNRISPELIELGGEGMTYISKVPHHCLLL